MLEAWLHGFILAGGLILPLGVQNVFIFSQGAKQTRLLQAMPSVLTAALCDTLLVIIAVLGVSVTVLTFSWLRLVLLCAGIVFLLYMGWNIWHSGSGRKAATGDAAHGKRKQILFAASVSLLNPHAILDTIVVIGMNSLGYDLPERTMFTFAVISVSWLWFIGLAAAGRWLGTLGEEGGWMKYIHRISAILIWGTAVYMAWSLGRLM